MLGSLKRKILNRGAYLISYIKLIPLLRKDLSGTVVLDCGANQGEIAALFAKTKAEVYAFEPDPIAYSLLSKRFEGVAKVHCLQKAVWIEPDQLDLYLHTSQDGQNADFTVSSSLIKEKKNVSDQHKISIEAIDLIDFIDKLGKKVSILKMDVEGAEIKILERIITEKAYHRIGLILVETHETKIPNQTGSLLKIIEAISTQKINNIKLNWI